jgi:hypothetical protein
MKTLMYMESERGLPKCVGNNNPRHLSLLCIYLYHICLLCDIYFYSENVTKGQTIIYRTLHRKLNNVKSNTCLFPNKIAAQLLGNWKIGPPTHLNL